MKNKKHCIKQDMTCEICPVANNCEIVSQQSLSWGVIIGSILIAIAVLIGILIVNLNSI